MNRRRFEVWAPRPARVQLHLDGATLPMGRRGDGWWWADADAEAGSRYGFSLDGGPPRPDPRSRRQPDGPHGLSAVHDHAHPWTDAGWDGRRRPGWVLYELHVGTFSPAGTFAGAVELLPELVDLGVDAVEVMPLATAPGRWGWGYDGVDLWAVAEAYGGPAGFERFVDAAHGLGLGVVLDVVYNHLGPDGNHLAAFGPYFTDRHRTPWGDAVNYDGEGAEEVRRFVLDNAAMWLRDFHCDGLRLDAVHAIVDDSPVHLLAELADAVAELGADLGRELVLIAESDENDRRIVEPRPGGTGLTMVWADDWHHALHTVLTGEADGYYADYGTRAILVDALEQAWTRTGSTEGVRRDAFVICTQNHDQVGNRAAGERLCALVDPSHLRLAAALLLTSPFTPMLFQGEEWGATAPFLYFTDHEDPGLAGLVRDGRRAEFAAFGWAPDAVPDPQDPATFGRSKLDRAERDREPHASLLRWYRWLLDLRRREPDLHDPAVPAEASVEGDLLVVRRGAITVRADLASGAVELLRRGEVLAAPAPTDPPPRGPSPTG